MVGKGPRTSAGCESAATAQTRLKPAPTTTLWGAAWLPVRVTTQGLQILVKGRIRDGYAWGRSSFRLAAVAGSVPADHCGG